MNTTQNMIKVSESWPLFLGDGRRISVRNRQGNSCELCVRGLCESDFETVSRFEAEICEGIPHNEEENIYQPFSPDALRKALGTGYALGLYRQDMLAAFLYVIPRPHPDHNVLMDVAEEIPDGTLSDVLIVDCMMVHRDFRGYGLQRQMFAMAEDLAARMGIGKLCGTASPKNKYSIRNFEAAGYRCLAIKPKYRSQRCFFVKWL